jgi:hypothetical protein
VLSESLTALVNPISGIYGLPGCLFDLFDFRTRFLEHGINIARYVPSLAFAGCRRNSYCLYFSHKQNPSLEPPHALPYVITIYYPFM